MLSIHPKHLNTPRLVADSTGTTVWKWDQAEPFGNNPANEDPDANSVAFDLPLRLPGQRYDQETGLHYNYFRDYDPSIGRYGQSDPIGLRAGNNTYAYVGGEPLTYSDIYALLKRVLRHEFQIWEITTSFGASIRGNTKRADRWEIYANVPDCFALLDVREERYQVGRTEKPNVSIPIIGKGNMVDIVIRDMVHKEYIWGPPEGERCCGKESFSDFTYEKEPSGLPEVLKRVLDFIRSVDVPSSDSTKGRR